MIAYLDVTGLHNAQQMTSDINTLIGENCVSYSPTKQKGWYRVTMTHRSKETIVSSFRLFAASPYIEREVQSFKTGDIVLTREVHNWMSAIHNKTFVFNCIQRHISLDWGNLEKEDKDANDAATMNGDRILSAYDITPEGRIWIITDADRLHTTILFPHEY